MSKSKIEWCDKTWNPVTGCTPISPGCANCYAERMAKRLKAMGQHRYKNGFNVTEQVDALDEPYKWKKPCTIFVCSMSDLFHESIDYEFLDQVFSVMALNAKHTYLVLTKRPENMKKYFEQCPNFLRWPQKNVWLGVTAESQEQADKRIPVLLSIPAAKRFVSVEPMLGPVDLTETILINDYRRSVLEISPLEPPNTPDNRLDWVICGGESGPNARPMHPDWARSLRDQCEAAGTPFMFKQWGAFGFDGYAMAKVGKKAAGRILDGVVHDGRPAISEIEFDERCHFDYKGDYCSCSGTAAHCNKTFEDCKQRGNEQRFGGFPSQWSQLRRKSDAAR